MVVIVIRAMMMLQVMAGGMVIVKMVILLRMMLQVMTGVMVVVIGITLSIYLFLRNSSRCH